MGRTCLVAACRGCGAVAAFRQIEPGLPADAPERVEFEREASAFRFTVHEVTGPVQTAGCDCLERLLTPAKIDRVERALESGNARWNGRKVVLEATEEERLQQITAAWEVEIPEDLREPLAPPADPLKDDRLLRVHWEQHQREVDPACAYCQVEYERSEGEPYEETDYQGDIDTSPVTPGEEAWIARIAAERPEEFSGRRCPLKARGVECGCGWPAVGSDQPQLEL